MVRSSPFEALLGVGIVLIDGMACMFDGYNKSVYGIIPIFNLSLLMATCVVYIPFHTLFTLQALEWAPR